MECFLFASGTDYNAFLVAVELLENYWRYSDADYEDTPDEIFHLGEEPLNALDSMFGFNSLRYKYEINDFNNDNWIDTATMYVEDDDMQIVMNSLHEVKIGGKFYKYVATNIIAEIDDNPSTLDSVRTWGILTQSRLYVKATARAY